MAGLTGAVEMTRSGRTLLAKLLKGTAASGISHVAIGRGTGGAFSPFGVNRRIGNNMEIIGHAPTIVHNDFPVWNPGPNGVVGAFYFINEANNQKDVALGFGADEEGSAILKQQKFNHLFMRHSGTSGSFGIASLFNADSDDPTPPTGIPDVIAYLGYVETDAAVRTIFNPARMFDKFFQASSPQIEFLGDRAISGAAILVPVFPQLSPDIADVSGEPNPALMVRSRLSPGVDDVIREIAVLGDNGEDIIAWTSISEVSISSGQSVFVRWALGL